MPTHHSSSSYPAIKDLRFPFKTLNIVFVEGSYHDISVAAGLIICKYAFIDCSVSFLITKSAYTIYSSQLLHSYRTIEQRFETMQLIAHGIAQQWFGIFLSPYKWYVMNNSRVLFKSYSY